MNNSNVSVTDYLNAIKSRFKSHPSKLAKALRASQLRILEYKEVLLHKNELGSSIVSTSYTALTANEKYICDIGFESMDEAVFKIDTLLAKYQSVPSVYLKKMQTPCT